MDKQDYKLSVIIPARREEFLARTVQDLIKNKTDDTEIIVGLDGEWADPGIEDHPDLTILYVPEAIGQRAMQNRLCRMSRAKYVMKVDAHCAFDKGFDAKMLEAFEKVEDNVVMVPIMRNLWVFDWVCGKCGNREYQGPTPTSCPKCDNTTDFRKDIVWIPKESPQSVSYCFDSEPHFQYFKEYAKRQEYKEMLAKTGLTETMSLQGSCFMMRRDKYWELGICDEEGFGSWGSQGIETACKMWLSGGRVLVNHSTWYAHLFRTQGGDFSFPYPQSGRQVQHAKHYAKDLFFNNKWEKQIHPLSWLLKKFWPINGWTEEDLKKQVERERLKFRMKKETLVNIVSRPSNPSKGIIFYTANRLNLKIAHAVQDQLRKISKEKNIPIVSCSLKPMPHFGDKNIHLPLEKGVLTMFFQILTALNASDAEIIFYCEDDLIYSPTHFDFTPPSKDKFYYNVNWWRVRIGEDRIRRWEAPQVSGLVAYRGLLIDYYRRRISEIEKKGFNRSYEPGGRDRSLYETWQSKQPNIDIRHSGTMTKDKLSIADFRDKSTCINWQEGNIRDLWCYDILKRLTK